MNIETVNELIASLESAGEMSIREQKFLKLAKAYQQLAAENVALKAFVGECAIAQDEGNWTSDVEKTVYVPATEWMPPTPVTDRIVAGIKADGVEEFVRRLQQCVDEGDFVGDEVGVIVGAIDCGKEFSQQLREEAE
ncbi:hypothetical protein ACYBDH_10230 [Klebsiella pneumoniae]|uniref:hypothetical protein n=1 Tax=Klebsiella pneumoniae TaxID=573 RepID=UPI003D364B46|nr:hypothetical protein [Klebsiella pneumoniae]